MVLQDEVGTNGWRAIARNIFFFGLPKRYKNSIYCHVDKSGDHWFSGFEKGLQLRTPLM